MWVLASFVSARTEYYSLSQASGELKHVERGFSVNKNVLSSSGDFVWHSCDIHARLLELVHDAEKLKGKKFQKNSNIYLDTVVVLSREQVELLQKELGSSFSSALCSCVSNFEQRFQSAYGFTPVGYSFHGDEGHVNPVDGSVIRNYHFHVISLNFDFKIKAQPLRKMQRSDWSQVQDLVGDSFSCLGFIRGESKEKTKKKHLDKNSFVANILLEKEKQLAEQDLLLKEQKITLENVLKEKNFAISDLKEIEVKIEQYKEYLNIITSKVGYVESLNEEIKSLHTINQSLERENTALTLELDRIKIKNQRLEFESYKNTSNTFSRHENPVMHTTINKNRNCK